VRFCALHKYYFYRYIYITTLNKQAALPWTLYELLKGLCVDFFLLTVGVVV